MYGAVRVAGAGPVGAEPAGAARAGDEHGQFLQASVGRKQCVPPTVFVGGTQGRCCRPVGLWGARPP